MSATRALASALLLTATLPPLANLHAFTASCRVEPRAPEPVRIPIEVEDERVYVPVAKQGDERVWFILDTGVGPTFIDVALARRWGLAASDTQHTSGVGGGGVALGVLGPLSLRVGDSPFSARLVRSAPLDSLLGPSSGRVAAGIIGSEFFAGRRISIDFARRELRIDDSATEPQGHRFPLSIEQGIPYVDGSVTDWSGRAWPVTLLVDLGAKANLLLSEQMIERTHLTPPGESSYVAPLGAGFGGRTRYRFSRVPKVAIGGDRSIAWGGVVSGLSVNGVLSGPWHDGLLGVSLLRGYRLTLDYRRSLMWMEPATPVAWNGVGEDLSGAFLLRPTPRGAVRIDEVVAGSAAATAGAQVGDVLLAVDGESVEALTLGEIRDRLRREGKAILRVRRGATSIDLPLQLRHRL